MPKIQYSERFVTDFAAITSARVEAHILSVLANIELFPEFGSVLVPKSIKTAFGENVRKVVVNPFDLIYTYYEELDLIRVEALVHQRAAR